jgi:hypothetical protein
MRRFVMAVVVVVVGVAGVRGRAQGAGVPASPFGFAVFGLDDVQVRDGARPIDGPVGSNNATATIGTNVRVTGAIVGRTIRLRRRAMPSELYCLLLQSDRSGLACQAVGLPVFDGSLLPGVQVNPGRMGISIPKNGTTAPIPAGDYGRVKIRSGGVLRLAGGSYSFRSINVGPRAQLLCLSPCEIGVADSVTTQKRATLGGSGTPAEGVRLRIARRGNRTVFSGGKRSTVAAIVYAPGGRIQLRDGGNFVGSFVGKTVSVGKGALVQQRGP